MIPQAVMTGNITRRGRPQRRITPAGALVPVYQVLGRPLALDPCAAPKSHVEAIEHVMPPADGLAISWLWTWFMNPPYEDLGLWLRKAWLSALRLPSYGIGLLPVRPHRNYWGYAWAFPARRLCFPPAMEFGEFGSKAPFANVYVLWDARPNSPALARFDHAFRDVGQIVNLDTLTDLPQSPIVRAMTDSQNKDLETIKHEVVAKLESEHMQAVLRTVQAHLGLSFDDLKEVLSTEDFELFESIPLAEIFGFGPEQPTAEAAETSSASKNGRRKPRKKAPPNKAAKPASAKAPKAKAKAKANSKANGKAADTSGLEGQLLRSVKKAGTEGISTADIVEEFQLSKFQARSRLEALAEQGKVELRGKTKAARWHVVV